MRYLLNVYLMHAWCREEHKMTQTWALLPGSTGHGVKMHSRYSGLRGRKSFILSWRKCSFMFYHNSLQKTQTKKKKENPNELFGQPSIYLFQSRMPTVSAHARFSLFSLDSAYRCLSLMPPWHTVSIPIGSLVKY